MRANLFSTLAKYARRQDENFLTEALVSTLNIILDRVGNVGGELLGKICGENTHQWFSNPNEIELITQIRVEESQPDIIITIGSEKIVFIEVKHDSGLGREQLESYYKHLEESSYQEKQLVLLTRSKHSLMETSLNLKQFHHVCWYEIAAWFSEAIFEDEVTEFIVMQFIGFLKEKDMSMEKVKWEFIEGLPAMSNLLIMLGTAISEAAPEAGVKRTMGWSWGGYYLEGEVFLGFRFNDHLKLSFENNNGTNPTFKEDLMLEQAHFFSLSAGEQLECLIGFVKDSYSAFNNSSKQES